MTAASRAAAALRGPAAPSDAEFGLLAALIERESGIHLSPAKKALLTGRLSGRVRQGGFNSFGAYYRHVAGAGRDELTHLIDAVCTNETHFFREPHHFDFLAGVMVPRWVAEARAGRRERRVRVWSAGCSTGEEPYSLAMQLAESLPWSEGWKIDVLATDLSTRVLARAQQAIYPGERLAEVPVPFRRKYLLRGTGPQSGKVRVAPAVRALVRFQRHNLSSPFVASHLTDLDLVTCRNVLIYFRPELRQQVIERIATQLAPGGYLLLGHAESLPPSSEWARTGMPTVYQRMAQERSRSSS